MADVDRDEGGAFSAPASRGSSPGFRVGECLKFGRAHQRSGVQLKSNWHGLPPVRDSLLVKTSCAFRYVKHRSLDQLLGAVEDDEPSTGVQVDWGS